MFYHAARAKLQLLAVRPAGELLLVDFQDAKMKQAEVWGAKIDLISDGMFERVEL